MQNVADVDRIVQDSALVKAVAWGKSSAADEHFQGTAAAQMARCLERLIGILDPQDTERNDLRYFTDPQLFVTDIVAISDRYVNKTGKGGRTARNYRAKAERLVTEYLRYAEAPSEYRGPLKVTSRRASRVKKTATASPAVAPTPVAVPVPTPSVSSVRVFDSMRDFPLGGGAKFLFQLPNDDGISQAEFDRISQHLQSFVVPGEPAAAPA